MTEWQGSFDRYFDAAVSALPGHEVRQAQRSMAHEVRGVLAEGGHLVVEAGTGSGKSFAYLLPALHAGKRVVVATHTIPLQEQIIEKDLPFLLEATGSVATVALAKGRGNYLCRQRLWEADRQVGPNDPLRQEVDLILEALHSWDGDVAHLPHQPAQRVWAEVASTSEDCLGQACEFFEQNPYRMAKVRLGSAELIVANHALYLVDLATGGGLLPDHDVVILDEAHHLPKVAAAAFTATIGRYALTKLLQKIRRRFHPPPEAITFGLIGVESRLADWLWQKQRPSFRLIPDANFLDIAEGMLEGLLELRAWLENAEVGRLPFTDAQTKAKAPLHRPKLLQQLGNLIARWEFFSATADAGGSDRVNWVELDRERGNFELRSAPLDVASELHKLLWSKRSAVLTSATLKAGDTAAYFRSLVGLPESTRELSYASPFDYPNQARLYLPMGMPEANAPAFEAYSHRAIDAILEAAGGSALVLFTSNKAMSAAHQVLAERLPFPVKKQGEAPRSALVKWLKETPKGVLFATSSFWEGVDVPGQALSCVIIDRLPFAVPDDPVVEAHVQRLEAQGRRAFVEFQLPEAILRLKQGFGRLIRSRDDRGVVVILDGRMRTKGYGRQILKALPTCPVLADHDQLEAWMHEVRAAQAALSPR